MITRYCYLRFARESILVGVSDGVTELVLYAPSSGSRGRGNNIKSANDERHHQGKNRRTTKPDHFVFQRHGYFLSPLKKATAGLIFALLAL